MLSGSGLPSVPGSLVPPPHCQLRCLPASLAHRPVHPLPPWSWAQITAPCLSSGAGWGRRRHLATCSCRVLGFQLARCDFVSAFFAVDPLPGLEERSVKVPGACEGRLAGAGLPPLPCAPCRLTCQAELTPRKGPRGPGAQAGVPEPGDGCLGEHGRVCLAFREWLSGAAHPPRHAPWQTWAAARKTTACGWKPPHVGLRARAGRHPRLGPCRARGSPLYTPRLGAPSSATRYHVGPGLQPVIL